MTDLVRIATRESPLALWQAHFVKNQLQKFHPGIKVELIGMTTRGDQMLDSPLTKVGGKGLFVKELEVAMLEGHADIAVHSMKDVPMHFPDGLGLAVICEREDPRDAFVSNTFNSLEELPQGARVGTCSLRRQCQIREVRPDLQILDLRGNVNTRLRKLDEDHFDAIILAVAGLIRLEMQHRIRKHISTHTSLPAVGQGAVGIECRSADTRILNLLTPLHHQATAFCVSAERAMNKQLEGGCQVPIAGFAELNNGILHLRGLVGLPEGTQVLRAEASAPADQAEALGQQVADTLLKQGASDILKSVYGR